jgi:hypothetical protein
MAYRELGVIEIREVLRRFCLGEGLRAIARERGATARRSVGTWPPPWPPGCAGGIPG